MSCLVLTVPPDTSMRCNETQLQRTPKNLEWSSKSLQSIPVKNNKQQQKQSHSQPQPPSQQQQLQQQKTKKEIINNKEKLAIVKENSSTKEREKEEEEFTKNEKKKICFIRLLETTTKLTKEAQELVNLVQEGLSTYEPELVDEGEGGTYFLKNKMGQRLAVFKPFDEQPRAENNPKKKASNSSPCLPGAFAGIKLEETHRNEVAAYFLDHEGFAGVPLTTLVECNHYVFSTKHKAFKQQQQQNNNNNNNNNNVRKRSQTFPSPPPQQTIIEPISEFPKEYVTKVGSLQKYVEYEVQSWDMGPSHYPTREVHRIGVLDIRLLNLDRHGGNILVTKNFPNLSNYDPWNDLDDTEDDYFHLVPIDHAFSLPDCSFLNGSDLWFEWFNWSQADLPFTEETLQYINKINIEADVELLLSLKIRKQCIKTMILTTSLLKYTALVLKMNLKQIARLMIRENHNKPSVLEELMWYIDEERGKPNRAFSESAADIQIPFAYSSTEVPTTNSYTFPSTRPEKLAKSRSTTNIQNNKSSTEKSTRNTRTNNRGNSKQARNSRRVPISTQKPEKSLVNSKSVASLNQRTLEEETDSLFPLQMNHNKASNNHNNNYEELLNFLKTVRLIIETRLQLILNDLHPKPDIKIKKTSSISNELFLLQLVEEQLKIQNGES